MSSQFRIVVAAVVFALSFSAMDIDGRLDPKKATAAELHGQEIFFGKGKCGACHTGAYFTDNLMHNLQAERFYKPQMFNGMMASAAGPNKTFPLRESNAPPPYMPT